MKTVLITCLMAIVLIGCSHPDEESRSRKDHLWQQQTDALEQARDVGARADAENRRRERLLDEAGQ